DSLQKSIGEVEPGRRRRDRAALAREHGLVALAVFFRAQIVGLALDVRWQGRNPGAVDQLARARLRWKEKIGGSTPIRPLDNERERRVSGPDDELLVRLESSLGSNESVEPIG